MGFGGGYGERVCGGLGLCGRFGEGGGEEVGWGMAGCGTVKGEACGLWVDHRQSGESVGNNELRLGKERVEEIVKEMLH